MLALPPQRTGTGPSHFPSLGSVSPQQNAGGLQVWCQAGRIAIPCWRLGPRPALACPAPGPSVIQTAG